MKIYSKDNFRNGNFIEEVEPIVKTFPSGTQKIRTGKFFCLECNKTFLAPLTDAERTQRKCCSYECTWKYNHKANLGTEEHYLYARWQAMRQRCLNKTCTNYARYGKRGIKIDPKFDDFTVYVKAVENLPTFPGKEVVIKDGYQLDRIDNNRGYFIDNLRWISSSGNTANRNKLVAKNHYIGVTYSNNNGKYCWVVQINYKNKRIFYKGFLSELEAAKARDAFIIQNSLPHKLNFPRNATTIP